MSETLILEFKRPSELSKLASLGGTPVTESYTGPLTYGQSESPRRLRVSSELPQEIPLSQIYTLEEVPPYNLGGRCPMREGEPTEFLWDNESLAYWETLYLDGFRYAYWLD